MTDLREIAGFLDSFLGVAQFPGEKSGVYRQSVRPIHRLGLALEPWPGLAGWVQNSSLDGLLLHRPWKLQTMELPPDVGIMAYHLPFDEHLTLGFNPHLAVALGLSSLEVLGYKEGRAIGMIGSVALSQPFETLCRQCELVFGGLEAALSGRTEEIGRVAVVGAMTDELVREAARRGAGLYVTGQVRQPGLAAVRETGLSVLAVGHSRSETWGLRVLADVLHERWPTLGIVVSPQT